MIEQPKARSSAGASAKACRRDRGWNLIRGVGADPRSSKVAAACRAVMPTEIGGDLLVAHAIGPGAASSGVEDSA